MGSYDMTGHRIGGSSNFLAQLGGVGLDWQTGLDAGLKAGLDFMQYNNAQTLNPTAVAAQYGNNINAIEANQIAHNKNLMEMSGQNQAFNQQTANNMYGQANGQATLPQGQITGAVGQGNMVQPAAPNSVPQGQYAAGVPRYNNGDMVQYNRSYEGYTTDALGNKYDRFGNKLNTVMDWTIDRFNNSIPYYGR